VSLTRLENYCVVYLATLESRDVICANWRPAAQFRVRSCAIRLCPHRSFPSWLFRRVTHLVLFSAHE
jgi:hypothetical protein